MMENMEKKREEILDEIAGLPVGNITRKTIRGKSRMYLQWREDGKTKSRYIRGEEEADISAAVERRKALEKEYHSLQRTGSVETGPFLTNVKTGAELTAACRGVEKYGQRECMSILKKYLQSDIIGKVCLVYGLRRTGKTTILLQAISELPKDKTAYVKIMTTDSMANLNHDLKQLSGLGYRYVFIDEVTLLKDFIDGASLLSDVYAMCGMKIVLSGTDSLGFAISADEELYDRTVTIHTTFIPFREYSRLLGIHDIDEYIRYGGTFRVGETDFDDPELNDEGVSFRDDESTRRYIDTAIARNIQHSLACYQDGSHFRNLIDLYEKNELTNAVNRIIEDMNHRFLVSIVTRDFESHDLGSAAQIQRKRAALSGETSVLDKIDRDAVTARLMAILEIKNREETSVEVTEAHIAEIQEYLSILDLIVPSPVESIGIQIKNKGYMFLQPGMRYCQAQALVFSLMKDESFKRYAAKERKEIENQILEEVRGRMLEEIVLLETMKTLPKNKRAFKLLFPIGEFDMVIQDTDNMTCELFEIKHSDQIAKEQLRHLKDGEKLRKTEYEFGTITKSTVLYRGINQESEDISYRNVVEYLENIKKEGLERN